MKNDPAFPTASRDPQSASLFGGLTKRELFAAMAMTGMIGKQHGHVDGQGDDTQCAELSVAFADALIKELERKE